jgi:hypothetical protein
MEMGAIKIPGAGLKIRNYRMNVFTEVKNLPV